MDIDPSEFLEEARKALADKEYEVALKKYQWFYENSTKIKESYYGVRLSYCLDEWAQLGREYPPAMAALVKLERESLDSFQNTRSRQSFHEYSSIAYYLEHQEEVFNQFCTLHESKDEMAGKLFTFVYEYCASNKMWDICREYLGNGYKQYKEALETFDYMMEFAEKKSGEIGASIFKDGTESIKREVLWILDMLYFINAPGEYDSAMSKVKSDLKDRGHEDVYQEICERAPNQ